METCFSIRFLLLLSCSLACVTAGEKEETSDRDARGFFTSTSSSSSPVQCQAMAGTLMNSGVCRSKKQCQRISGTEVSGATCSNGNVCCQVTLQCTTNANGDAQSVTSSGTHITSPTTYTPPYTCRFNLPRPAGVCQVRLDFVNFNLAPPDALAQAGDCITDVFTVTGADNLQNFQICGMATGQNLILDYGSSDQIMLGVTLGAAGSVFDILVTYIPCADSTTSAKRKGRSIALKKTTDSNATTIQPAPDGCTQYYTQASDTVRSFNYPTLMNGAVQNPTQFQLNNQMYCVCVRNIPGSTQITWRGCTENDSFFISGTAPGTSLTGNDCPADWVDIPGSPQGRYCGGAFPPEGVTTTLKPYVLCVHFDEAEVPGANLPLDPTTGCPIGFTCFSTALPPGPVVGRPCDPTNIPTDVCLPGAAFDNQIDLNNYGFCLQYQVT